VPPSAILLIAAVGVTIVGDVCGQPTASLHHCPKGALVVTGVDNRDFSVQDVHISVSSGWVDPQGYVHLLPLAEAALHARSMLHTWTIDGTGRHNHASPLTISNNTLAGQPLPPPAVTKLPMSRNGASLYRLENVGEVATMLGIASIELAVWLANIPPVIFCGPTGY
jgi:hypothetical protein